MAYIGRDTDKISNVEVLDNITFDGSSSYTLQKGGSNFTPSSANTLLVSIDGVVQAGNFTVSGSTIDFGTAVAGTSTCDFVLHYGIGLITTPADGTVTNDKINYPLAKSGATVSTFNRTTSDGKILELEKDGAEIGNIGAIGGDLAIGTGDAGLRFYNSGDSIFPVNTSSSYGVNDNATDLGYSGGRFKDIYLGGGLYVGGTGTANKLDDYEEGTWTPQYVNGPTINGAYGEYTKIGQIVHVIAKLYRDDATANSNTLELGNLPFAVAYDASNGIGHSGLGHASSYGGSTNRKHGMLDQSSGNVNLIKDGTLVYSTYDDFHSNQRFALYKWSYQTDA